MKIGILGTGDVAKTLGTKFVELGHEVMLGGREATNQKAADWVATTNGKGKAGSFKDAALFGEMLLNCTAGMHSLEALEMAGREALGKKILIDVANPLDFSRGMPPTLSVCNTDSLGEQIQRAFPDVKVVKALNTVAATVMVKPDLIKRKPDLFICGNELKAKKAVKRLLKRELGWSSVIDIGDISGARATEMLLPFWLRMYGLLGQSNFGIKLVKGEKPKEA